jgi:hypothetical protein
MALVTGGKIPPREAVEAGAGWSFGEVDSAGSLSLGSRVSCLKWRCHIKYCWQVALNDENPF